MLPPSRCWCPHDISLKGAEALLVLPEVTGGSQKPPICSYSVYAFPVMLWINKVCTPGVAALRCISPKTVLTSERGNSWRNSVLLKRSWMIWGPMQLSNRWWGYILGCQNKICYPLWGRMIDSWKTGWMSREHFRDESLYAAYPVQCTQEGAAVGFVISGLWHLPGGFSLCTLWSSFLWRLVFGLCCLCWELIVHFFAMIHQVFI